VASSPSRCFLRTRSYDRIDFAQAIPPCPPACAYPKGVSGKDTPPRHLQGLTVSDVQMRCYSVRVHKWFTRISGPLDNGRHQLAFRIFSRFPSQVLTCIIALSAASSSSISIST